MAWQGNQKPCAALVKTGHRVQAMKQAAPLTERVNGEILGNRLFPSQKESMEKFWETK